MSEQIVCVDTNVMIWGILQNAKTTDDKNMSEKVQSFLDKGFKEKKIFAISIITFAEFMVKIPPEKKDNYIKIISENFIILPFSEDAALKAAEIFFLHYHTMKGTHYSGTRPVLRQDIQILASILAANANVLITEDKIFQKLSAKYITTQGIPEPPPEQLEMRF